MISSTFRYFSIFAALLLFGAMVVACTGDDDDVDADDLE